MKQLTVIGATTDGKSVISGEDIFRLLDEMGFPLCMAIDMCAAKESVIDWVGFMDHAQKTGWTVERIWNSIKFALEDSGMAPSSKVEIKNRCQSYLFDKLKSLNL